MKRCKFKHVGYLILGVCLLLVYHKLTVVPNGNGAATKLYQTKNRLLVINSWLWGIPISNLVRSTYSSRCTNLSEEVQAILIDNNLKSVSDVWIRGDAWCRPFNIVIRSTNSTFSIPIFSEYPGTLYIWSSGENGVNEWGGGDDIIETGFTLDYE